MKAIMGAKGTMKGRKRFNFFIQKRSYTAETENKSLYNKALFTPASASHPLIKNIRKSEELRLLSGNWKSDQLAIHVIYCKLY